MKRSPLEWFTDLFIKVIFLLKSIINHPWVPLTFNVKSFGLFTRICHKCVCVTPFIYAYLLIYLHTFILCDNSPFYFLGIFANAHNTALHQ